jgi:hypothetical protein
MKRKITIIEGRNKIIIEKTMPQFMVKYNGKEVGLYGTVQAAEEKALKLMRKVV